MRTTAVGSGPANGTDIDHNEVVSHTGGFEDQISSNQNSTENVMPQHNFHSEINMRHSVHTPSVTQSGSYRDAISSSGANNCRNGTGQTIATRVTRNTDSVSRNSGSYMTEIMVMMTMMLMMMMVLYSLLKRDQSGIT